MTTPNKKVNIKEETSDDIIKSELKTGIKSKKMIDDLFKLKQLELMERDLKKTRSLLNNKLPKS